MSEWTGEDACVKESLYVVKCVVFLFDRLWLSTPDGGSGLAYRYSRVQQLCRLQWQDIAGHAVHQRSEDRNRNVQCKTNVQCSLLLSDLNIIFNDSNQHKHFC